METREFTSASFNKFLNEKKLMASQCSKCNAIYLPPRPLCTRCYSKSLDWVRLKGQGTLNAYTVIAVGPSFMAEEGYNRENHYCAGIVHLEEGPKISARILGVDTKMPGAVRMPPAM